MRQILQQNKFYFILLGLYFLGIGLLVVLQEKGDAVLFLNGNHTPILDFFFKTITYLGDGLFAFPLIVIIILFKSIFRGVIMLSSVLISFIVVQSIKLYIFPGMPRPMKYFSETIKLHFVEGVDIHSYNSFPSGHSAQAFSIFLLIALFSKNKQLAVLYFIPAVLVTVSRMYLAQHFLMDIYFGALIATVITFITYTYFMNHSALAQKERLQRGWISN